MKIVIVNQVSIAARFREAAGAAADCGLFRQNVNVNLNVNVKNLRQRRRTKPA